MIINESKLKINEYTTTDYHVSKKLMNDTKKKYNDLLKILDEKNIDKKTKYTESVPNSYRMMNLAQMVQDAYKAVDGKVSIDAQSTTYAVFEGIVKGSYTTYNSVSLKSYTAGDLGRMAEDLTMAYFRTNGGNCNNTMDLISYIKNGTTKYGTNFILESVNTNESITSREERATTLYKEIMECKTYRDLNKLKDKVEDEYFQKVSISTPSFKMLLQSIEDRKRKFESVNESTNESMKVQYHSLGSGQKKEVELDDDQVKDLKKSYEDSKAFFAKKGIKSFEDYVGLVLSFNN